MDRIFIPAPGSTTGATGTDEYWAFMHRIFARAITRDQIAEGSGFGVQEQKRELLAQLHGIIIRYTAQHTIWLSGRKTHAPTQSMRGGRGIAGATREHSETIRRRTEHAVNRTAAGTEHIKQPKTAQ